MIAGIAIVFIILIGILFCTFFVSGKKSIKRKNAIEMIDYNNNELTFLFI